jgi:hypothetical protein
MTNLRAAFHHQLARTGCIVLLVTPALACASDNPPVPGPIAVPSVDVVARRDQPLDNVDHKAVKDARTAAVADGVTTALALSSGAMEMNPLVSTSPLGLLALTGAKIGLMNFAKTLPEQDKRMVLKTSTALWSGAAVNNLMVLMAAPTPLAVVAGVLVGVLSWRHSSNRYAQADRTLAGRAQVAPVVAERPVSERPDFAYMQAATYANP